MIKRPGNRLGPVVFEVDGKVLGILQWISEMGLDENKLEVRWCGSV